MATVLCLAIFLDYFDDLSSSFQDYRVLPGLNLVPVLFGTFFFLTYYNYFNKSKFYLILVEGAS